MRAPNIHGMQRPCTWRVFSALKILGDLVPCSSQLQREICNTSIDFPVRKIWNILSWFYLLPAGKLLESPPSLNLKPFDGENMLVSQGFSEKTEDMWQTSKRRKLGMQWYEMLFSLILSIFAFSALGCHLYSVPEALRWAGLLALPPGRSSFHYAWHEFGNAWTNHQGSFQNLILYTPSKHWKHFYPKQVRRTLANLMENIMTWITLFLNKATEIRFHY